MTASRKTKLVAAGGGLAALVLAAGALAQTDTFSPKEESENPFTEMPASVSSRPSGPTPSDLISPVQKSPYR